MAAAQEDLARALGKLAREQQTDADLAPELLRPLDGAFQDRLAAQALASLRPASVLPFAGRGRRLVSLALPFALAASLAVWLLVDGAVPGVALPAYTLAVRGGIQELRGEPASAEPLRLGEQVRLELVLRPEQDVSVPVAARLFLVEGGRSREWKASAEASAQGAIRLTALGADVTPVAAGPVELLVLVGERDAVAGADSDDAAATPGVKVFRRPASWP